MHPTLIRRTLGGLVPPKIATPSILTSGQGEGLGPLVGFYSRLPKGPAPQPVIRGVKARFFNGKNASGAPIVWVMGGLFALGYFIDYQTHLKHHKNHAH
ncbi:ATP17, subunit F of the F0 sector of mitochondrial F1F0 ATP synthase [Irpex rosettiformis]|uniref:ATP17, subunit F of the F0 sector of mitochondrial F1F0 ATP synthase n=1 Tax=Irpex rosettiformis TaxID=378272 RepID=A0ACB8U2R7_9APHY|nr:ATP17, subunit F of the F0 sector of mitochondrial F1F0 ATP synthase [Irpex rosettiformis]